MKRFGSLLLLLAVLTPAAFATDWFVRVDGGTRYSAGVPTGQCDGLADAPYPGAGVNRHCAFNEVSYVAFDGTYATAPKWVIAGGDAVHIGPGQFRVGYRGPNPSDHNGLANAGNPFAPGLPSVPSGTAAHPTQFIGAGSGKTQVFGGYGAGAIFGLQGTGFVTITGIELTDHGQCSRVGTGPMCNSSYPLDDYAGNGIVTDVGTHDIVLNDVNIHGFTGRGIIGPIGGLVTVTNVRIAFNGAAGWDFDDGTGTKSVNGQVSATKLLVEGNGCNEEYPVTHAFPAISCFEQDSGGYGDGIGTPNTPLNFTCNQCTFRYNMEDGDDLLHVTGSLISITDSASYGNRGQQWKWGAMKLVDFENNTTVHNCNRLFAPMPGAALIQYPGMLVPCRAGGDGIAFNVTDGGTYTIKHNSYVGYGSTSYDIGCVAPCTKPNIIFQGNVNMGYPNPIDSGRLPGVFYWDATAFPASPILTADHNIYYRMRTLPSDGVAVDPLFVGEPVWTGEASLDNFNFALSPGSPAIAMGAGANVSPVVTPPAPVPPSPAPPTSPATPTPQPHTVTLTITVDGQPVVLSGTTQ